MEKRGGLDMAEKKDNDIQIREKLEQHRHALSRTKALQLSITALEKKISKINRSGHYVTDSVSRGKKGSKPLGKVTIVGFAHDGDAKIADRLEEQRRKLMEEERELVELSMEAEEYIAQLKDIEMRNILDLYYLHDLTWVQVSHSMNELYKKGKYTADSCRCRHDRFFKKK